MEVNLASRLFTFCFLLGKMVYRPSIMPFIQEYHFGSITIDGKTYTYDVEARWSRDVLQWWRKQSHIIGKEDVKRALAQSPELIIIGTGQSGVAQVSPEAREEIKQQGIELIIDITGKAVKLFNSQLKDKEKKVIGLFHLTC